MLKLIIIVLFFVALYFVWHFLNLKKRSTYLAQKQKNIATQLTDSKGDELPEKSQLIKENREAEKEKNQQISEQIETGVAPVELSVTEEDQRLFDEVAQLFFEKAIRVKEIQQAEQIQQEFLSKMPAQTASQIGEFDLGEWCIYWNYHNQSLEYYVGKYGIFYTHVDHLGIEHKEEYKFRD